MPAFLKRSHLELMKRERAGCLLFVNDMARMGVHHFLPSENVRFTRSLPKYKHLEALSSPRYVSGGLEIGLSSEEKRTLSRFRIEIPLLLTLPGTLATAEARTRDLSASGVFFYTNFEFAQDAEIDFVMTLPAELTHTGGVRVICKAKVVRVQRDSLTGHIGIAASIYSFDFIAAAASSANGS